MIQFQSRQVRVFAILVLIFLSQEQAFLNLLAYVTFSEWNQAPLSTGFSRQEYWSELPFPSLQSIELIKFQN